MAFECTPTNEHKCTSFTALLHMHPLYQQCKKPIDYTFGLPAESDLSTHLRASRSRKRKPKAK
ncbi:hypothetical protein OUZ56_001973 [Daphnia magna]|uniref:Uncharacterized protein n=1 Tax=Daphnia magna TaxID=35525 RepID=A0ABR0A4R1_9CRUS|nr:hypothetical protein OUZ56_001973 [Daphnia magna]